MLYTTLASYRERRMTLAFITFIMLVSRGMSDERAQGINVDYHNDFVRVSLALFTRMPVRDAVLSPFPAFEGH